MTTPAMSEARRKLRELRLRVETAEHIDFLDPLIPMEVAQWITEGTGATRVSAGLRALYTRDVPELAGDIEALWVAILKRPDIDLLFLKGLAGICQTYYRVLQDNPALVFWMLDMSDGMVALLNKLYTRPFLCQAIMVGEENNQVNRARVRDVFQAHVIPAMRAHPISPFRGCTDLPEVNAVKEEGEDPYDRWFQDEGTPRFGVTLRASSAIVFALQFRSSPQNLDDGSRWGKLVGDALAQMWLHQDEAWRQIPRGHLFVHGHLLPYLRAVHALADAFGKPMPGHLLDRFLLTDEPVSTKGE